MLDDEALKVLACPYCVTRPMPGRQTLLRGELVLQGAKEAPTGLACKDCGRTYAIEDGIPNLLVEEAKQK